MTPDGEKRDPLVLQSMAAQDALERQALAAQDRLRLAVARNAAENGRLFCAMLFAVALGAFFLTKDRGFAQAALLAAMPVGLSVVADIAPGWASMVRAVARFTAFGLPVLVFFLLLHKLG